MTVQDLLRQALDKHKQHQWDEAGQLYRKILATDPRHAEAMSLLGRCQAQLGNMADALECGARAIELKPSNAMMYVRIATTLMDADHAADAIPLIESAIKADRRSLDAWLLLGDAYHKLRRHTEAIGAYEQARKLNRSEPVLYNNMGNALLAAGRFDEAIAAYEKAIRLRKDYADAYYNMANGYYARQQYEPAIENFRKAREHNPKHYKAITLLASALTNVAKGREALLLFQEALQISPSQEESGRILLNLGNLYKNERVFDQAAKCYETALLIRPKDLPSMVNLSQVYQEQGRVEQSKDMYRRILEIDPDNFGTKISQTFALPPLYESVEAIEACRAEFEANIDDLLASIPQDKSNICVRGLPFYLGYQGRNDRVFMEKTAQLIQHLLPPAPELSGIKKPNPKPKIGFISRYISKRHTIGKLNHGIIQGISRDKFDVTILSVGSDFAWTKSDDDHPQDKFLELPLHNFEILRNLILAENLDILFYLDIGMDPTTYFLAGQRLAPVQCVTWGHPVTTGLETVDYYLTSELVEIENPADHYTETPVLLKNLPTVYNRPDMEQRLDRKRLGIEEDINLYFCPQSLFKFHPEFDAMLAGILQRDPKGVLVLVSHYSANFNQMLMDRFAKAMPQECVTRIRMMPRLKRNDFMNMMLLSDVILDPLWFGGGNTTYEALAMGTPIVTLPTEFMRGRVTLGCYKKMGMLDCVASTPQEYIEKAVKIATDKEEQTRLRQIISEKSHVLFGDTSIVSELEAFFTQAIAKHAE